MRRPDGFNTARMTGTHFYEPASGHRLRHDPIKAIVAPRPIGWISTMSATGAVNLAPYSFFNLFSSSPPILGFASDKQSDTLTNARQTGEFVFNVVGAPMMAKMSATSYAWSHGIDEMTKAGIAAAPCRLVKPPRVAESPASFECKVLQIIPLIDLNGQPPGGTLVLGQAIGIHIDEACLKDGAFDTAAAEPVARCGGWGDYAIIRDLVRMKRPTSEDEATLV